MISVLDFVNRLWNYLLSSLPVIVPQINFSFIVINGVARNRVVDGHMCIKTLKEYNKTENIYS